MNEVKNNNVQDIVIGNDCGRFKVSVNVGNGVDYMVELPTAVWNYSAIVSALVRFKYSGDDVEAIVSNSLLLMQNPSSISEDDAADKVSEFNKFQEYREKCKSRAKELLAIGKELGLEEI